MVCSSLNNGWSVALNQTWMLSNVVGKVTLKVFIKVHMPMPFLIRTYWLLMHLRTKLMMSAMKKQLWLLVKLLNLKFHWFAMWKEKLFQFLQEQPSKLELYLLVSLLCQLMKRQVLSLVRLLKMQAVVWWMCQCKSHILTAQQKQLMSRLKSRLNKRMQTRTIQHLRIKQSMLVKLQILRNQLVTSETFQVALHLNTRHQLIQQPQVIRAQPSLSLTQMVLRMRFQ